MIQLTELECILLGYLLRTEKVRTEKVHTETVLHTDDLLPCQRQSFQRRLEVIQSAIGKVDAELFRLERAAETKTRAISDAVEAGD